MSQTPQQRPNSRLIRNGRRTVQVQIPIHLRVKAECVGRDNISLWTAADEAFALWLKTPAARAKSALRALESELSQKQAA